MADKNSYRITVRIEGKEQKAFDLGEKTLHIPVGENVVYQIEEVGSSALPDNIVFSRVNNDLWVMPEGKDTPQAIIEGYFGAKNAKFGAFGVDGSLYNYGIEELKAINVPKTVAHEQHDVAEEIAPTSHAEDGSGLSIPLISTAVVALGGIVAVAAGGGGSSKSNDQSSNHSETTTSPQHESTAPLGAVVSANQVVDKSSNNAFVDTTRIDEPSHVATPLANSHSNVEISPEIKPHTSEQPTFHNSAIRFIKGQADEGDIVTTASIDHANNAQEITYYLQGSSRDIYHIDHKTGLITLTKAGADWINAGHDLPNIEVIADDGEQLSNIAILDVVNTSKPDAIYSHDNVNSPEQLVADQSVDNTPSSNSADKSNINLTHSIQDHYGNDVTHLAQLNHYAHHHPIPSALKTNSDGHSSLNVESYDSSLGENSPFEIDTAKNAIHHNLSNSDIGKVKMEYLISGEDAHDHLMPHTPYDTNGGVTQFADHFSEVTASNFAII